MVPTVESQLLKTGWVNKDQLRTSVISRLLGFANQSPSVKAIQNELRLKKQKINSSDWLLLPWIFWEAKKKMAPPFGVSKTRTTPPKIKLMDL